MQRKVAAMISLLAIVYALIYGPQLHVHLTSSAPGAEPTVHAHFEKFEAVTDSPGPAFDHLPAQPSRFLDGLISNVPHHAPQLAVIYSVESLVGIPKPACETLSFRSVHAHDPPDLASAAPRSPPSA